MSGQGNKAGKRLCKRTEDVEKPLQGHLEKLFIYNRKPLCSIQPLGDKYMKRLQRDAYLKGIPLDVDPPKKCDSTLRPQQPSAAQATLKHIKDC